MQLFGLGLGPLLGLLAATSALTVAMYLLRLKRTRVAVPFLPLWEGLLSQRQSSRLFSRLRHVLSLIVALLIMASLVLALGDPRPRAEAAAARHTLILVDAGVTMRAHDVLPDRLHAARERALRLARGAGPALHVLVAQMDASTTPLSTFDADRSELERAIDGIRATDLPTDYARAYRYALDVLRGSSHPELVVISDAPDVPSPEVAAALQRAGVRVRYETIGKRGQNVAITQFAPRRYPLDKGRSELLVELASTATRPEQVELTLLGDGAAIDVQRLTLAPGATLRRIYDDVTGANRTLEARIAVGGGGDDLATDDRAYAVLPERRRVKVLCVSGGDRYLEAALLLDEYLDVDRIAPEAYRSATGYDAVIFDRFVPEEPAAVPALFIEPNGKGAAQPLRVEGRIDRPYFDKLERDHPLLRFTALRDVNVVSALKVRAAPGDTVLGADARGPLLVAGARDGVRFVALTFDPSQSDVPLRAAWPLLVLNTIDWFTAAQQPEAVTSGVGETLSLALPAGVSSVRVRAPDGSESPLPISDSSVALTPAQAGFYRVTWAGGERWVAANLSPKTRRDLTPRARHGTSEAAGVTNSPTVAAFARPPWMLMLGIALLLLTAEWITYNRRWTV